MHKVGTPDDNFTFITNCKQIKYFPFAGTSMDVISNLSFYLLLNFILVVTLIYCN